MGNKRAILLCAFGSSSIKGIDESIGMLKRDIEAHFDFKVVVEIAFTSKVIISKLQKKGYQIKDLAGSIQYLQESGIEEVTVQPLYMMEGSENLKLRESLSLYETYFSRLIIKRNLFGEEKNLNKKAIKETAQIIERNSKKYTHILIAGHGSQINDSILYTEIKKEVEIISKNKIYIANLEGKKSLEKAMEEIKREKAKDIMIMPIFLLKGRHILRDISEGENSWKRILEKAGLKVQCQQKSLLQYSEIRNLYLEMLDFSDNLQKD